jgi:hypothetical protein
MSENGADRGRKAILIRRVTKDECPWLSKDLPAGMEVTEFTGTTYGAITPQGSAVHLPGSSEGFVEIPSDSFELIE